MSKGSNSLAVYLLVGCLVGNTPTVIAQDLAHAPVTFTANAGQWDSRVGFQAKAGGAVAWFTSEGVDYQFCRDQNAKKSNRIIGKTDREQKKIETMLIGAKFVNANPAPEISGEGLVEYRCNYFLGKDSTKWRTDVPNYESIVYRDLYSDIDLKVQSTCGKLEYDFIVQPGGDLAQVEIEYNGIRGLSIDSAGCLQVKTRWGKVTEHAPVVYQEVMGERQMIRASYELRGKDRYGFKLREDYNSAIALIVDPVATFSTYLGGSTTDQGFDIAVNASGEVYLAGTSNSSNFPTASAYDNTLNTNSDIVVTKFNAAGNGLVFSTFIGGTGQDIAYALNISQASGFGVALTGKTTSTDFPVPNALDATHNGGTEDAFLAVLSNAGNSLALGTFLGGSNAEQGNDLAVQCGTTFCDTYNYNVWITGTTYSTNFPNVNAVQTTHGGGITDAFLVRYNFTLFSSSLVYSTYYGGNQPDRGMSIAVSGSPVKVYVAGETNSANLPGINGFQSLLGGNYDVFIAAFSVNGSSQVYPAQATYFGGNQGDAYPSIISRSSGIVHLLCGSLSPGLATAGAFDQSVTTKPKMVLARFSSTLAVRDFCTYLGSNTGDLSQPGALGSALAVDSKGNMYLTGRSNMTDFPMKDAWDSTHNGDLDVIVAKMNSTGSALLFSSYIGGTIQDYGHAVAVDAAGCMYALCETYSGNFPTLNAYDATLNNPNGWTDIAVAKICIPNCCAGLTGNVDCDGADVTDIADLSTLIDYLYISFSPLCCKAEANCDGSLDGAVDIADLSALIDYLYISFTPVAACQ